MTYIARDRVNRNIDDLFTELDGIEGQLLIVAKRLDALTYDHAAAEDALGKVEGAYDIVAKMRRAVEAGETGHD